MNEEKLKQIRTEMMVDLDRHLSILPIERDLVVAYIDRGLLKAHGEGTQHGIKRLAEALKEDLNGKPE